MEKACLNLIDLRGSIFFNLSEKIFKERDSMQPVYTRMYKKAKKSGSLMNITNIWIFLR